MTFSLLPSKPVEFWVPPLISIDTYKYRDTDSIFQTIDAADYIVLAPTSGKGTVEFVNSFDRPDVYSSLDAVEITFTSGYGDVADIPPEAKAACKLMLTVLWDNDESKDLIGLYAERAQNLLETLRWGSYE